MQNSSIEMNKPNNVLIAIIWIFILLILSFIVIVEGDSTPKTALHQNVITNGTSSLSPQWLKKWDPRPRGCRFTPWICRQGEQPGTRIRCCGNICIDLNSNVNNCGLCGIRCPFTWQCCRGLCTNTNRSPFNCGRCGNRCPRKARCEFGMCGYSQPGPRPKPRPPKRPWPPKRREPPPHAMD